MRTDLHKPSTADPAEYTGIAYYYQGTSPSLLKAFENSSDSGRYDAAVAAGPVFQGNWAAKKTCDHCGAYHNHGYLFRHDGGELVHVGWICAMDKIGLPDQAAADRRKLEKQAEQIKWQQANWEAGIEWRENNSDVVTFLQLKNQDEDVHSFLKSLFESLTKWGTLSDRQAAAVRRWIESEKKQAEKTPEPAPVDPLADGRREIFGQIVSTKYQDSIYGETLKMLVKQFDGNKVWGTVPGKIECSTDSLVGKTIAFTATVTRSDKDEHFGFFKRPTGAKLVEMEEVA